MQWSRLLNFPDVSVDGKLARFKKELYQFGGRNASDLNSFTNVWCLDAEEPFDSWRECEEMIDKRHRFGCVFYRNQIYVAGGRAHKTETLSSVESYLPKEDRWIEKHDMCQKRAGCCLIVYKGKLHVLGGQSGSLFFNSMEVLQEYGWIFDEEMIYRRADFATVWLNHRIYAIGGKNEPNHFSSTVECFCDENWELVTSMNTPRAGHSACVLGDKIYVAGGENHLGPVKTIEVYTPEEDEWEVVGEIKGDPVGVSMVAL